MKYGNSNPHEHEPDARVGKNSGGTSDIKKYTHSHAEIEEQNEGNRAHGNEIACEVHEHHHDNHKHQPAYCCDDHDHGHHHSHGGDDCCSGDGCGCGHNHGEMESEEVRSSAIRFGIGAVLWVVALIIPGTLPVMRLAAFVVSYLIVGGPVLLAALRNIFRGKVFDENFLMAIATLGAFALKEYPEAVAVMLFYNVGELLSDIAVGRSRKSITALMDLKPEVATVVDSNGQERTVSPGAVKIGDMILVRPGERVPLDGVVLEGEGFIDNAALTGESMPVSVAPGQTIFSGGVCGSGLLKIQVTALFEDSTVSRILQITQEAADKKAHTERFLTRFAAKYTPAVVGVAVLIAIMPPLLNFGSFSQWIYRALTFLVVSCPCALVLSVPLGFFGGIGRASKLGVLVKGGEALETLAKVETVVFDKTGTLTTGKLLVQEIIPQQGVTEEECLSLAAAVERYSNHPAASAVMEAYKGKPRDVTDFQELPGRGVQADMNGQKLLVGNRRLMEGEGIKNIPPVEGTVLFIALDGRYMGAVRIADTVRGEAKDAVARLKKQGVRKTVMLTGDTMEAAEGIADMVGIDQVYASLMPGDKVARMEEVLKTRSEKRTVAYVGDGINDAPVLKTADVGVAMGAVGTDAAVEAADVVIMTDNLERVADAVQVSKRTNTIVVENIAFALAVKALVMVLTFFGLSEMWEAVFADVGVTVLTVLNAARILRGK